ncbi:MAG TPA: VCBS repeat-containing protein, partial [Candidatus Limnocylindrales bacterium]|nr:VCBS repeat-containing protein [Candidatus Limnocylindrales bacterium]
DGGETPPSDAGDCISTRQICFSPPEITPLPWGITAASFGIQSNKTDNQTVIVSAYGSSEIVELQWKGQFEETSRLKVDEAPWLTLGSDFDQDGHEDYLVSSPGSPSHAGALSVWQGQGAGKWSRTLTQTVGRGTYMIALRREAVSEEIVAVAASFNQQVIVPLVAHKNSFPTAVSAVSLSLQPTAAEFGVAKDGKTRLYTVGSALGAGKLVVFDIGNKKLSVASETQELGAAPNDITLGDLNGDDILDAVVVDDSNHSHLYALTGDAMNNLTVVTQLSLPAYSHAGVLIDIDHDGYLDSVTLSGSVPTLYVCYGDGLGGFGHCESVPHGLEQPTSIIAGDIDADGWADLIVTGFEGRLSRVRILPTSDQ